MMKTLWILMFVLSLAFVKSATHAQDSIATASEEDTGRGTSFIAVSGPTREDVPGGALLVGAYIASLGLLSLYVLYCFEKQRGVLTELARLKVLVSSRSKLE